jgi:long-chain acyl-CoA synthetase
MDRHGSLRESLRLASEVIKQGYILLIFPEGTRSTSGVMVDFKPSLGYLALTNNIDVLPIYLDGTHDALPKGSVVPQRREIAAHIGPPVSYSELRRATAGLSRADAYREASRLVELAVRRLAPRHSCNRVASAPISTGRLTATSVMVAEPTSVVASAITRESEES